MIKLFKTKLVIFYLGGVCFVASLLAMTFAISAYAAMTGPVDLELSIARAAQLYDTGNLKDAMAEFEIILQNDPLNRAANEYIDKIRYKLNEKGASEWELSERITGYRNALNARKKIEITDPYKPALDYGGKPYERFINQTSFGSNSRNFEPSTDTSFGPSGFFIAEHLRLDQPANNWQNTFSLDARYHDNSHEDARIRRIMYSLSNPGGMRFIAGDTSTRLSRYIMRGMYYRGVNLALNNDANEFKILWGAVPHFVAKTQDTGNKDTDIYIYPRKVFGARDAIRVLDGYKIGVSYMELKDSERVRTIDTNYNPKLNRVAAIDQNIEVVPEKWRIETEDAFSTSDEDRTDKDILVKDEKLKDFAHYIRSDITLPRFKLINSYERIGADFRSYSDLASTNTTWLSGITSDREKIDNYLEYRPYELNPVYLDLYFSRVRNNLDRDNDLETGRQQNYGVDLRFTPEPGYWMPQSALRLKIMDRLSVPGSQYASNDVSDRDIIFELAKKLYGIDLNTSYTYRNSIDNIDTLNTYSNIYNIRAAKELTDMVLLSAGYQHYDTRQDEGSLKGTTGRQDFLNLSTALRLWAGANLSFDYSYEDTSDRTGTLQDTNANIYSTTFSWPFSHYSLNNGREFSIAPYFTYQLTQGSAAESKNRYIWTAALDANYQLAKGHRISASFLYRQDENSYYDPSTGSSSRGIEDRRFLLTYKKIFQ